MIRRVFLLIVLTTVCLTTTKSLAQVGDMRTIRAFAVRASAMPDLDSNGIVMIRQLPDGFYELVVRSVNGMTGSTEREGVWKAPAGVQPVDVIWSEFWSPGDIMVLDSALNVHVLQVTFDATGSALGVTSKINFNVGDPALHGMGMSLAEVPNGSDPKRPFLVVGTDTGQGFVGNTEAWRFGALCDNEIVDLTPIPQVGYFALLVLDGNGNLTGIDPDEFFLDNGTPIRFMLSDPRREMDKSVPPLRSIATAAVFEPNDEPLTNPVSIPMLGADGTNLISEFGIPAIPELETHVSIETIEIAATNIGQVARGSLYLLAADGTGLFADPGFNFDTGLSGTLLTIVGSSLMLSPNRLNFMSQGKYVTAVIEVENAFAANIMDETIALFLDDGTPLLPAIQKPVPQFGDADNDGNPDLSVKFDRRVLIALILPYIEQDNVVLQARWRFDNGIPGRASAVMSLIEARKGGHHKQPAP